MSGTTDAAPTLRVRPFEAADWPALAPLVTEVIRAGDTYAIDPGADEGALRAFWIDPPTTMVTLAEADGAIVGTAHMGPNRGGPGAHVANASYMVAGAARGRGVGRALVVDSLRRLRDAGFEAVQFNAVAETNAGALALYRDLGFAIVGTVPRAFDHPVRGKVALHVLHRGLADLP